MSRAGGADGADGVGGRGGQCVHGADGRTSGQALTKRSGGRADKRTGRKGCGQWSRWADGAHEARTCGRAEEARTAPKRRGRSAVGADGRMGGQAVGRTGGLGGRGGRGADGGLGGWADGRIGSPPVGQTGRRADERVGLGLKGHIPRGPLHSWAPSPLASSERERAGCLGVQWGPARLHVKHPYLAPGLACLV